MFTKVGIFNSTLFHLLIAFPLIFIYFQSRLLFGIIITYYFVLILSIVGFSSCFVEKYNYNPYCKSNIDNPRLKYDEEKDQLLFINNNNNNNYNNNLHNNYWFFS